MKQLVYGGAFLSVTSARADSPEPWKGEFDPKTVPFSRYGSYVTVSPHFWEFGAVAELPRGKFCVRFLRDEAAPAEVFAIDVLVNGKPVVFEAESTAGCLRFTAGQATLEFCIAESDLLLVRGINCGLRLSCITGSYANCVQVDSSNWEVMPDAGRTPVLVSRKSGTVSVNAPWIQDSHHVQVNQADFEFQPDTAGHLECSLQFFEGAPTKPAIPVFDTAASGAGKEFELWCSKIPALRPHYEPHRRLAAYVLWSETVAARGLYKTPIVWGSKNWMTRLWSWDHCFVAMGLARSHPELAWQQYIAFRDMQDPRSGGLCDSMSNVKRSWVCTKNPVHGWALRHLLKSMPQAITPERLKEAYEGLQLWTSFWLEHRNFGDNHLPAIIHPDESFDNTTSNTIDGAVNAPEIATYLAIQMDVLAEVAARLGYAKDQKLWQSRSETLIAAMIRVLWDSKEQRFVSRRVTDGFVGSGDCIFAFVPMLLGERLPAEIQKHLANGVLRPGRFRTPFGVSTEALDSSYYDPNSYVRGPVWAPPTIFISEGLERNGHVREANQIRSGFLWACLQSGMSEHFDAKTGSPAGDPAYNWTAASFLSLAAFDQSRG